MFVGEARDAEILKGELEIEKLKFGSPLKDVGQDVSILIDSPLQDIGKFQDQDFEINSNMVFSQLDLYSWDDSLSVISRGEKFFICLSSGENNIFAEKEISKNLYELLINELHIDS